MPKKNIYFVILKWNFDQSSTTIRPVNLNKKQRQHISLKGLKECQNLFFQIIERQTKQKLDIFVWIHLDQNKI